MKLKLNEQGLIPAIIQDANTKNVLMLGYMNQEAFDKTMATKKVTFYSVEVKIDCGQKAKKGVIF